MERFTIVGIPAEQGHGASPVRSIAPDVSPATQIYRKVRRFIPFLILALASLLISPQPRAAADTPPANAQEAIVGAWTWFDGTALTFRKDGTFGGHSAEGEVSGKWKLLDVAQRQYKLLWSVNDEVKSVETVTLAADGKALSGEDTDGKAVSGRRQENATPSAGSNRGQPLEQPSDPGTTSANDPTTTDPFTFPSLDLSLKVGVKNGKLVITSVAGNPIAGLMKLKVGDRVLKIGGKSADGMNVQQAESLMRGSEGTAVDLEILRIENNEHVNLSLPHIGGIRVASGDGIFTVDGGSAGSTISRILTPPDGGNETGNSSASQPLVGAARQKQARESVKKGSQFARDGKWPEAEAEYRKALRLDPGQETVWKMLGQAFSGEKKWKEAVSAFRAAVRLAPETARYHADLAQALLHQGKPDQARGEASEAMRLGLKDDPIYKELGLTSD